MKPPSGPDLRRQLGRLLSTARERHDLTMRDVGAKCDLSETYYGMIECAWAASAQCGRSPQALANFGGKRSNHVGLRKAERCHRPRLAQQPVRRRAHGAPGGIPTRGHR